MAFEQAERRNAKARIALDGPAGSGKTFTMLTMLKLFDPNPGVIDSERDSSRKYAHKAGTVEGPGNWKFRLNALGVNKGPDAYMVALAEAARENIKFLGIDSFSHSWIGALEEVDRVTPSGGSKFSSGWKSVSPKVNRLVDAILNYPGHVICTMRAKTEYELVKDEKTGKSKPQKVGLAPVARDGTDYEFDLMLNLSLEGHITVAKSRAHGVVEVGQVFSREEIPVLVSLIKSWLDEGAPVDPVEDWVKRINLSQTNEDLTAVGLLLANEPVELRAQLKAPYLAKKLALTHAAANAAVPAEEEVPT